jgi:tyrosinase
LGLDYRSSNFVFLAFKILTPAVDAPNFFESSFWDGFDNVTGLGGWGNPNSDWSVPNGAFSTMQLAYPSPHTVRRNFTLLPFDEPYVQFTQPLKIGNASFSASVIEALLETSPGDYKTFQTVLEAFEVRAHWICWSSSLIPM